MSKLAPVATALLVAMPALANEAVYNCNVLPATSTVLQSTDVTAPFSGTFIGNYDATNNPTGTRTLPGLFGGSGNTAIPYTASFALAGDINSHPLGALTIGLDEEALQMRISGLDLDLLGATPGALNATLNINYQSFHTQQPNAIFPGGVNIPLPIGNGSVSQFHATQTGGPAIGVLVAQKNGSYNFTAAVPVDIVTVATISGQTVLDGTPQPAVLPLTGNVVATPAGLTITLSVANQTTNTQPITNGVFTDQPLAIPTVIPTGGTANVLMSGTLTSVTVASNLSLSLSVAGTRAPILGDLNADYRVDCMDLSIQISRWGLSGLGDLDASGAIDSFDVAILLNNWQ